MAQRLTRNHDFLKLLAKCTPAQRKAILKEADNASQEKENLSAAIGENFLSVLLSPLLRVLSSILT